MRLSTEQIKNISHKLHASDEQEKLNEAFGVLQISRRQFEKLHTKELKINCLLYHVGLFEFAYYQDSPELIALGERAYDIILCSSLIREHVDVYGPHSRGLVELDVPRIMDVAIEDAPKLLRQSMRVSKPKDSGVEPGFLGHHNEDVFLWFFREYPNVADRIAQIQELGGNVNALIDLYKSRLSRHVVKLTYDDVSKTGEVFPNKKDLARTSTMKRVQKKFGSVGHAVALQLYQKVKTRQQTEINLEAIAEVLANDLARAFGMSVQDQYLVRNIHHNKHLRFLLKAEWIEGASLLQPLAGSRHNKNYYVDPVLVEGLGITHTSNNSIPDLAEHFALFACLGDRDKVGSRGQNLLVKLDRLIGIDFGHAFPRKNHIVGSLGFDFSFRAPKFKNYSVFRDASRSQLMQGVRKLARWQSMPLKVREDERIFDDYVRKFSGFMQEDPVHAAEYQAIIDDIKEKKRRHIASRNRIVEIFKPFLNLSDKLIDTLENVEKLWAAAIGKTSMRSPDDRVMLQHLRVTKNPVLAWRTEKCNPQTIVVTAIFNHHKDAEKALATLKQHVHENALQLKVHGSSLLLRFPRHRLAAIAGCVREDNIKAYYHREDYRLAKLLSEEKALSDSLEILEPCGLSIETSVTQGRELHLSVIPENTRRSQEIANFVAKGLRCCRCSLNIKMGGTLEAVIPRDKLKQVQRFLSVFNACYDHYEKARNQLNALSRLIKKQEGMEIDLILKLIYHDGEFKFHLMVRSGDSSDDINLDLVTEGDILQTISQLQTIKTNVLRGYQNYKNHQYGILLEQQVAGLCKFLNKQYANLGVSQYFMPLNPGAALRRTLMQWREDPKHLSRAMLKTLGETLRTRLDYITQQINQQQAENFGVLLEEKGKLDDMMKSIRNLQLIPRLHQQYARSQDDRSIETVNYSQAACHEALMHELMERETQQSGVTVR